MYDDRHIVFTGPLISQPRENPLESSSICYLWCQLPLWSFRRTGLILEIYTRILLQRRGSHRFPFPKVMVLGHFRGKHRFSFTSWAREPRESLHWWRYYPPLFIGHSAATLTTKLNTLNTDPPANLIGKKLVVLISDSERFSGDMSVVKQAVGGYFIIGRSKFHQGSFEAHIQGLFMIVANIWEHEIQPTLLVVDLGSFQQKTFLIREEILSAIREWRVFRQAI